VVTYKLTLPIPLATLPKYLVTVVHFVTRRKVHLLQRYEEIFDVSSFANFFGERIANEICSAFLSLYVSKTKQKIHKSQF